MTDFSVGAVVGRSFQVWLRNFAAFTLATLLIDAPAAILSGVWASAAGDSTAPPSRGLFMLSSALSLITAGALTAGTLRGLAGQRPGLREMLGVGLRRFWRVLPVSIVSQLAIGIGVVLLVVPGLALAAGLWVAIPAAVEEGKGLTDCLSRSWELTKGRRWRVLAVALVTLLVSVAFLLGSGAAVQAAVDWGANGAVAAAFEEASEALAIGFIAVASAASYHELAAAREGMAGDQLAAVFE